MLRSASFISLILSFSLPAMEKISLAGHKRVAQRSALLLECGASKAKPFPHILLQDHAETMKMFRDMKGKHLQVPLFPEILECLVLYTMIHQEGLKTEMRAKAPNPLQWRPAYAPLMREGRKDMAHTLEMRKNEDKQDIHCTVRTMIGMLRICVKVADIHAQESVKIVNLLRGNVEYNAADLLVTRQLLDTFLHFSTIAAPLISPQEDALIDQPIEVVMQERLKKICPHLQDL